MVKRADLAVAVVTLVALVALTAPSISLAQSEGEVVEVHLVRTGDDEAPFAFEPAVVEITPGTTVRWINDDDVFHTVTSTDSQEERKSNGEFEASLSSEGDTFEVTFDEPGTFEYFCQPHAGFMFGTVEVEGQADGSQDAPLPAMLGLVALLVASLALAARR